MPRVPQLASTEWGAGPPVLLVHGLNGFKEGWGALPGALAAAGHRVVAVDLPGSGDSRRLRGAHTPEAMARAVGEVLDGLGPAAVVAHSLGAQAAVLAAVRPGARVRGLALVAPFAMPRRRRIPPHGPADLINLPLVGGAVGVVAIALARRDRERRRAFLSAIADPGRLAADPGMRALLDDADDRLAHADLGALVSWARAGMAFDLRRVAPRVTVPALVVVGDRDRVARPEGGIQMVAAMVRGTLLRVPDAAHFPHLERADLVVPAIVSHIGGLG
ncbi:MAG: alpha/beta fold hydrolase [Thermoleophilia bacterium]